jgi:pilus assembly protein CpaE
VSVIGTNDRELTRLLRDLGFRVSSTGLSELPQLAGRPGARPVDAFVFDVRSLPALPREIAVLKRQFPSAGFVIVASQLEPTAMLDAMRMGVNEWVAEPIKPEEMDAAIRRVSTPQTPHAGGKSFAIVGAKGGVGTTTVAVNLATMLRKATAQPVLLIDLHLAHGDAAVFLGVEPRFSVLDALENMHRLDESYFKGLIVPTKAGPDLLGSSNRTLVGPVDVSRVRALIDFASSQYPYVVLDCPRSDSTLLDALESVSSLVVVANQELATLRNASRMATALRQRYGKAKVRLAMSRFDPHADIGRDDVERVLGGAVKYLFPSDYRASVGALNRGEPLILQNHSRLAGSFEDFARDLGELPGKSDEGHRSGGLFSGLLGRK